MNKKLMTLGAAVLVLGGLAVSQTQAFAYKGDPSIRGPYYSEERHAAMTAAFEKGDYTAWKKLMAGKGRVTQVITEQNFGRFAEAHKLALEGKKDEANQIRKELGLGLHDGTGRNSGGGFGRNAK